MKPNLINVEDAIFNFKKVYKKYFDDNSLYEIYPQYESDSGEILGFSLFIDPKKIIWWMSYQIISWKLTFLK